MTAGDVLTVVDANHAVFQTSTGGIVRGGAQIGHGVFNGTDNHVSMGNLSALNFERTDPFSLTGWILLDTDPAVIAEGPVAIAKQTADFAGWDMYVGPVSGSHSAVVMYLQDADANAMQTHVTLGRVADGRWHHFACVYDGSSANTGISIYVDGVAQAVTGTGTLTATMQTTGLVQIGDCGIGVEQWKGGLKAIRVYASELTAAQVLDEAQSGRILSDADCAGAWELDEGTGATVHDRSGNGHDGTWQGTLGGQWGANAPLHTTDLYAFLAGLPTSNPEILGHLYTLDGALMVSAGPV